MVKNHVTEKVQVVVEPQKIFKKKNAKKIKTIIEPALVVQKANQRRAEARSVFKAGGRKAGNKLRLIKRAPRVLPPNTSHGEVVALLNQIVLPYEANLHRIRTGSKTITETALAKNFMMYNMITSSLITADASKRPVFEDATAVWNFSEAAVDVVNFFDPYIYGVAPAVAKSGGTVYNATSLINPSYSGASGMLTFTRSTPGQSAVPRIVLDFIELLPTSASTDSYGPYLPCFTTSMGRAIWIDACGLAPATVSLDFTTDLSTSLGADAAALFFELVPFTKEADSIANANARYSKAFPAAGPLSHSTATITVNASGYYFATVSGFISSTGTAAKVTPLLSITTTTSIVSRFLVNANLHVNTYSVGSTNLPMPRDIQVLGSAVLVSNVTAPLYKDGVVYGASFDETSCWYELTGRSNDVFTGSNSKLEFSGRWQKGCYAWVKPRSIEFRDCICRSVNGFYYNNSSVVDPDGDQNNSLLGFNIVRVVADVANGVPASKICARFCTAFEFTTSSQMFALNNGRIAPSVTETALFELASLPCFSENPKHENAFTRAISRAGNWIWDGVKTVAPYASLAGNILSLFPPTSALGSVLSAVTKLPNLAIDLARVF